MSNKASKAGHLPMRTCVVCRNRKPQTELMRFVFIDGEIVFDLQRCLQSRGYYLCDENRCLEDLEQWLKKKKKRSKLTR
jgi:hypothetical protein